MKLIWRFLVVAAATVTLGAIVHTVWPHHEHFLTDEDDLVENLSVTFFMLGFLFNAALFFRFPAYRAVAALCATISLAGALDELSFGERLFNLEMPKILGTKVDAIHDLIPVVKNIGIRSPIGRERSCSSVAAASSESSSCCRSGIA